MHALGIDVGNLHRIDGMTDNRKTMLGSLHLENVGPAPKMTMGLGPRLNLITGDNGLGKSLLLDAAWRALTGTWPGTWAGKGIVPEQDGAAISWGTCRGIDGIAAFDFSTSRWTGGSASAAWDTLWANGTRGAIVLYARVDGGISICDPLRMGERISAPFDHPTFDSITHVFQFRDSDIWDGLELSNVRHSRICEGLVRDVGRWAGQPDNADFEQLAAIVERLAGQEPYRLTRKLQRVYIDDARDFPIVDGPGGEVSVAHSPAGLRRILGLAYLVVWAWREHRAAAALKRLAPTTSMVLLLDEVESHLHPKWQRTILPSILRGLAPDASLQVIATTHSPMVPASVEPVFNTETDKLFVLDLENHVVTLREMPWAMQGDVINWLVSDTFGLQQARSLEAERAIQAAQAWMRGDTASLPRGLATKEAIHAELARLLPGHDSFWPRWIVSYERAVDKA